MNFLNSKDVEDGSIIFGLMILAMPVAVMAAVIEELVEPVGIDLPVWISFPSGLVALLALGRMKNRAIAWNDARMLAAHRAEKEGPSGADPVSVPVDVRAGPDS